MKHLQQLINHELLEEPQTGYGIAKSIHEKTGWKPSWGSIYPLLEHMQQEGLIQAKAQGRGKAYTLTKKGKEHAQEEKAKLSLFIDELIEDIRIAETVLDEDFSLNIQYMEEAKKGVKPLQAIDKPVADMRKELFRLMTEQKIKKHAKTLTALLRTLTEELRKI